MEIRFQVKRAPDGKYEVFSALEPFGGLASPWSFFGSFESLDELAAEAGSEISYQYQKSQ